MSKPKETLSELFAYHKGWKDGFAAAKKIWQDALREATKSIKKHG